MSEPPGSGSDPGSSPGPGSGDEELSPAERRVREFLAALGADAPRPDAMLASVVVRKARWQRTVRGPLRAAGGMAAALVDGVRMAVGARRGEQR